MEIGQQLGHYRIAGKLGAGGMGEVWSAEDTKLGRQVAIKVLPPGMADDPERLARFEREARSLAQLNHGNIAAIYGLEEDAGTHFLVLELVPGETLAERIERGPMPPGEALGLARQIAEGLAAAHAAGILHRDLKPANVKVTPDGKVKVLDFGLAKPFQSDSSGADASLSPTLTFAGATQAGVLLGTAAYMAPEQARGHALDRRADIWALGVILFEMLTGKRMFSGGTVSDTLASVLKEEPRWDALPAGVPAAARRLLRRALAKDPARRLHDVGDVVLELDDALLEPEDDDAVAAPPARGRLVSLAGWLLFVASAIAIVALALRPGAAPSRPPVHAAIPSPSGTTWSLASRQPGPPALSADGRALAFSTRDEARKVQLWVRRLDAAAAIPLAGTDDASYPFWSPDGKSIGFFAEGKLKRIDLEGGAVLTIADAPFGKGGSWGRDGRILFAPTYGGPLQVVPATGGEAVAVTELDRTTAQNSHRFPQWLPDGRHFLFLARESGRQDSRIMIGDLGGDAPRPLLRSPGQAWYVSGRLLFLRQSVLMAQPFDAATLELSGEPTVLAPRVQSIPAAALGIFTASEEGTLIYGTGEPQGREERLVWYGPDREIVGYVGEPTLCDQIQLSPDGRYAAFATPNPEDGREDVWVADVQRGTRRRVTFGPEDSNYPVWHADGKKLIFRTREKGALDLFEKAADGSGERRLILETGQDKQADDVSADGRFLLFESAGQDGGRDLYVLPLDGSAEARVFVKTPYDDVEGRFSPDGRWVAYESSENGRREVYIASFPQASNRIQVSPNGGEAPRWSDDGRKIYYSTADGSVLVADVATGDQGLVAGTPREWLPRALPGYANYDVHGDRLLTVVQLEVQYPPLALLLDWTAPALP